MSRHATSPRPDVSHEPKRGADAPPDDQPPAAMDETREALGDPDRPGDDAPAERYIGNRIADEDAPCGPDEVERLAARVLRAERRLRMIEVLSERSMALALLVHDRAMADAHDAAEAPEKSDGGGAEPAPARPGLDASAASFAKLSRTVRLCLDMEARADEALRVLQDGAPAVRAAREARLDREAKERRQKVEHEVVAMMEPVIREAADSEARERELFAAIVERMTFDCAYDDLQDWDTVVTVGRLCAELDLKPDWNAWTVDGWPLPEGEMFLQRPAWSPFNRVSGKPLLARTQAICRAAPNRLE